MTIYLLGLQPRQQPRQSTHMRTSSNEDMQTRKKRLAAYCHICHIQRPENMLHCRFCDSCIDGFDHQYVVT